MARATSTWPGRTARTRRGSPAFWRRPGLSAFPRTPCTASAASSRRRCCEAVVVAKGREAGKPLQVVYPSVDLLVASLALELRLLGAVRRLLPGPFTLLLPYPPGLAFPPAGEVPHHANGVWGVKETRVATIGVRVPAWPAAARAFGELPFPLLASSANPSGGRAPRSVDEVDGGLLAACDLVLDAGPVSGEASTIVDLSIYAADGGWRSPAPGDH